ncbi:MAG: CmcI family methyltransferase [Planctomycetaceae bacterium]
MQAISQFHKGPFGFIKSMVAKWFFTDLVRRTENFSNVTWNGNPIWQNILDLWVIQETIFEVKPALILETGTNRGGSSFFYAQLMDLIGHGEVITVDVEKLHDLSHPRVKYLIGSSIGDEVMSVMQTAAANANGPVMIILDSDHTEGHVRKELEAYAPLLTAGSFLLVQDGVIDTLRKFRNGRPGPLPAIHDFLASHPEFEIDTERCTRFPITHHPDGWLRRRPAAEEAVRRAA